MATQIKSLDIPAHATLTGSRVLAAVGMVFFAPIFLAVAVLIKCESRGPVLMKRSRRGADGNMIVSWEFRTVAGRDGDAPRTVSGAFLHHTRLETMPRLLNMLRGELSLNELLE